MTNTLTDLDAVPDWDLLAAAADRYRKVANLAPDVNDATARLLTYWAKASKLSHDEDQQLIEGAAVALLDATGDDGRLYALGTSIYADALAVAHTLHKLGYLRRPPSTVATAVADLVDAEPDTDPDDAALQHAYRRGYADARSERDHDDDTLTTSPTDDPGYWDPKQ